MKTIEEAVEEQLKEHGIHRYVPSLGPMVEDDVGQYVFITQFRTEMILAEAERRKLAQERDDFRVLLKRCRDVFALGRLVGFDSNALPFIIRDLEAALGEKDSK